ncbi:sensor domain-containing protein [Noviherbaspirillum massiliense]|uniref:sensor domain-containing protein n=1 Tax=Noviherbaspirillum massiliense TaxID=1465823 RepID=UPI0002F45D9F|nr:EAL domain-containing protein [Noviherbaspirillum massiliense]
MVPIQLLPEELAQASDLYRLILDNALDSFVAIDENSRIIQWSGKAEETFGWSKQEALGKLLTDTIIPERYHAQHFAGMRRFLQTGEGRLLNRHSELIARRKDGAELSVELAITAIPTVGRTIFAASIQDISRRKEIEAALQRQANINRTILDSMADAMVVADRFERLIVINPAAQRLLGLRPVEADPGQSFHSFTLFKPDRQTPYPDAERPIPRALRGESVDGMVVFLRSPDASGGMWARTNARPLRDNEGGLIGAVLVLHDITELKDRQEAAVRQSRVLKEQASLLDLTHDAILVRQVEDSVITYWNRGAERLYGYSREEAVGQVSHSLLKTELGQPLEQIEDAVLRNGYWNGELVHTTRDGHKLTVLSEWVLERNDAGRPLRFLETNTDVTQRVQAERALMLAQENYRLLVEGATDYAIFMMDPQGRIVSWNSGAERILGRSAESAIGSDSAILFTGEDRKMGEPVRELNEARTLGRSEDERWHLRPDGTRFWASGVVTPLWNEDGSLRGYVKIMRDETAQRMEEERTHFLANHDGLTGLPNRISFSNQLHKAIALSDRTHMPLAVMLLDLDKFKHVNDTFGHHTGDLLLKEVALRLLSSIRETDFVARLGGDEFVIIQSEVAQPKAAETLARKLVERLGQPYELDAQEVFSGTSIGIGIYPKDANNSVELLKKADLALYRAKHTGRHNFQFYTPDLGAETDWKKDQAQALRRALRDHQFELYYQPQVSLTNWKISTVEALLRWQATELEMMLPVDFLDVAEETGVIVEIGEWALRQACEQVRKWQAQGLPDLRISVNCSARQFSDPRFVAVIPSILASTGLAPAFLELEVSETMLAQRPEIKQQLSELRTLGIRITIDNFGTGHTALMELVDFEVDALKIDKSFVQHLPHRREDSAITSAIISLGRDLGVGVIAGGVETAEQLAYLKARDCTSAQGFIFSPPVSADKFEELVMSGSWSRINRLPPFDLSDTFGNLH